MKKIMRLIAVILLVVLCVSCGEAPYTLPDNNLTAVQQNEPKAMGDVNSENGDESNPVLTFENKEIEPQKSNSEKAEEDKKSLTCTLEIRCDTILENIDKLHPSKKNFVPESGVIFSKSNLEFESGESAFDVLLRATRENKIHMEFVNTPGLGSSYVEGIANIYEFDCGAESGWMYNVNGEFPGVGCSSYLLKSGDKISFLYTINQGRDIGGYVGE